ncbi:DoxX family protein [Streptomyces pristinaespiralis]|uniref:DoxX family protein n=2 Tax=Streptomyces pristinaespiralis TaxID=38300 RepID=B5H6U6_STRE2|nr:DoxX family protein [Streptomyces pristinaespiralis]ALC18725.1 membrane protein [Streptomyces pristinaespiralis]EDY62557.1 DoxX family protein [Streptomyces pristinaespiralis ATCC 25486]QMU18113.1 DoxX family protein [Streptomyces pristinaespiralis]
MEPADGAALLLRIILGVTLVAHGWNHAFGKGGIAGTAGWFASIGMRAPRFNAVLATASELAAGLLLILGLLTHFAAAATVGTMLVALVSAHMANGFFIFRPGQGYEYTLMIICVAMAVAALGPGTASVDSLADIVVNGRVGVLTAGLLGGAACLASLMVFWRPTSKELVRDNG